MFKNTTNKWAITSKAEDGMDVVVDGWYIGNYVEPQEMLRYWQDYLKVPCKIVYLQKSLPGQ